MAVITGFHAIEETIRASAGTGVLYVCGKTERIGRLVRAAMSSGVEVRRVAANELDEIAGGREHRGAAYVSSRESGNPAAAPRDLKSALSAIDSPDALVLVLDGITDPQNLGAILRSANLFEVELVVLPTRRSAQVTATVLKTSAGASNYVRQVSTPNIARSLQELKKAGFWIYGADAEGTPAHRLDLSGRVCLVMGSEGSGLGRLVREQCDQILAVPVRGNIDSLNVSVAAGICIYEVRRQQGFTFLSG